MGDSERFGAIAAWNHPRLSAPFISKSRAVGEGGGLAPEFSVRLRSKLVPFTCRWFLSFASGDILSPKVGGEEKPHAFHCRALATKKSLNTCTRLEFFISSG